MDHRTYNVLFLCTGNSARSILAEATLNALDGSRFRAYSAGSHPKAAVHPLALELLERNRLPTAGLHSKSWDAFAQAGAPVMDIIITVCDNAAGEVCPIWPGQPLTAHWGVEDPAAATGTDDEKRRAFGSAFRILRRRIELLVNLPMQALDRLAIKRNLDAIAKRGTEAAQP